MKKIIVTLFALWSGGLSAQSSRDLEVEIRNIRNDEGVVMVALFNSEKTFRNKAWKGEKSRAKQGTIKVVFRDVPVGEYAIAVYHDANENGKLDSNIIGIPREGFGFSHDAMGKFGPLGYEQARIKWTGSETYTINLKYYK